MRFGWRAPVDRDASACHPERFQPFLVRQKATNRRNLAHLDRIAIQAGQDPVKARYVIGYQQRLPAIQVPQMRLSAYGAAKQPQVTLNHWTPLPQTRRRQMCRQSTVQPPRTPLGASEIRDYRSPFDFKPVPHARQQPVKLVIAQTDLASEKLANTRLPHPTQTRQLRLAGTRAVPKR